MKNALTAPLLLLILFTNMMACSGGGGGGGGSGAGAESGEGHSTNNWFKQFGLTTLAATSGQNSNDEICADLATDSTGNIYCAGRTTGNLSEPNGGVQDAFIMKLNSSGQVLWTTQLGSLTKKVGGDNNLYDECNGVAVDSSGNVYCAGGTESNMGEPNGGAGNSDAFVLKLNSNGQLVWLTQLGSTTAAASGANFSFGETCRDVAVDSNGNVYCAGETGSNLGENTGGDFDAFIMKLNSNGNLQWVRQLGSNSISGGGLNTSGADICYGVAVDSIGNAYCAGRTNSSMAETRASIFDDAFVMKVNTNGVLQWVRQMGSVSVAPGGTNNNSSDFCNTVAVDSNSNVYCSGTTRSSMGEPADGADAFVLKLNSSGAVQWLKQLGATSVVTGGNNEGDEQAKNLKVDQDGNLLIIGETNGDFAESKAGLDDIFVLKLNSSGSIVWGQQFGSVTIPPGGVSSANTEVAGGLALHPNGDIVISGSTTSSMAEGHAGGSDIFVAKLSSDGEID